MTECCVLTIARPASLAVSSRMIVALPWARCGSKRGLVEWTRQRTSNSGRRCITHPWWGGEAKPWKMMLTGLQAFQATTAVMPLNPNFS
jgi:hypothetical protein